MDRAWIQTSAQLAANLLEDMEQRSQLADPVPHLPGRILTHLGDFDALTQGLQRGSFMVLAGSTGMGKTTLALNLARNISLFGKTPVVYGTNDSAPEALMPRILASLCDVESGRIASARSNVSGPN